MKMLVVLLIAAVALSLIVRDMLHPAGGQSRRPWVTWLRAAPFAVCAVLSLWIAVRAPRGRRHFSVDFSIVPEDLARSMTKVPHLVGVATLVLLAILAFGPRRLLWAFLATMLLGIGWEIGEATVVGHYGRLADLAPNVVGGLAAIAITVAIQWFIDRRHSRRSAEGPQEAR